MLTIHKTINGKMTKMDAVEDGCWVNLINPSEDELRTVAAILGVLIGKVLTNIEKEL